MTFSLKAVFQRADQYEGVRRINIYLLRLVFILMFFVLGRNAWTHILTHQGTWDPDNAMAWCVWSESALAGSPAESTASAFLWVILPIVAVPWAYVYANYIFKLKK
jgi:hypothetical protein